MDLFASLSTLLGSLLRCPEGRVEFGVRLEEGELPLEIEECRIDRDARTAFVIGRCGESIREEHDVRWNGSDIEWHRRLRNVGERPLRLVDLCVGLRGFSVGTGREQDYFYHAENPRIYQRMAIPVRLDRGAEMVQDSGHDALAGTKWADPQVAGERIGNSPYQPFPAILVGNYEAARGLVHGTLSQRLFYHNYLLDHEGDQLYWQCLSSCKGIGALTWQPGAVLDDQWYMGATDEADQLDKLFAGFTSVLRRHLPPLQGARHINRRTVVWGSWNDGINRKIEDTELVKMAAYLGRELPTVEWLQIDDGYAHWSTATGNAHGLGVPYEEPDGVDRMKFPRGMKAVADDIRARGVRPAIWIGGKILNQSSLIADHPEWFIDYSYRLPDSRVLDVSQPEVREYMLRALRWFTQECGYEAIKHDFWSYAFEDSHALLANEEKTGYEWRTWWLRAIRDHLPADGYLQTGCDIVMANPFLAEYFNNYRYGIDVGGGNWDHVRTNFLWGAACFALHIGDLFVPNSDSIGLFPGLSDNEALTAINYCLITRSLVEIAGWLHREPDHPRLRWLRKAICCPNNGQDVFTSRFDYRDAAQIAPAIWYLRTPHFSLLEEAEGLPLRTVAIFNLEDEERTFSLTPGDLMLPAGDYLATEVWALTTESFSGELEITIAPHASALLAISPRDEQQQILDADHELEDPCRSDEAISVTVRHAGDLSLALSRRPTGLSLGGAPFAAEIEEHQGNWLLRAKLPATARLTIR